MHRFANPARFKKLADQIRPYVLAVFVATLISGLYLALWGSPMDERQLHSVRIMYIHVPSAWMALFTYLSIAIASFVALVWKHPLAELAGRAMAPIGLVFTGLALITGSLWGKPAWGTYWFWDGRITSVLLLFFLYLGYMALWQSIEDETKAGRAAAILALVGSVNLPIIKFSVDWWSSLHQAASISKFSKPSIDSGSMIAALLLMAVAFKAFMILITFSRIVLEMDRRKLRQMQANDRIKAERMARNTGAQEASA